MPSIQVVSAICGNWWQESTMNPGIWEGLNVGNWTDQYVGFGLGQWTNVGTNYGRLYNLHDFAVNNGFTESDPQCQLSFFSHENYWSTGYSTPYNSLSDFLNSTSTDVEMLAEYFCKGWEGIVDSSMTTRKTTASNCLQYIMTHYNDTNISTWYVSNNYLSDSERYNNAVLLARYLMGGQPIPPLPVTRRKMPLWMMLRKRRFW